MLSPVGLLVIHQIALPAYSATGIFIMAKQPEEWHYLDPEFDNTSSEEEEDEEIIWVSKSEIKRDAEVLKKLGTELVELSAQELERIPLDEKLLASIQLAQKVQREARRRQIQYIGKLLRNVDEDPIRQALDKLKNRHNQQILVLHKLEDLRIRLIEGGNEVIEDVVELYPMADRQQLRTLIRNAKKEKEGNKPPKSFRLLFQYLKDLSESA
ncbi:putative alpha helix protein [Proteus hauseri ATCC 700826]|uniref:Dual-action ribosomal maturation protein DarP n=2 Tax=Proteus hauseri TaxID=183417 RepID=A0AAJ3HUE4_PROHU|nr:putative alpha helix protein [Proteus hauseri ATCC 700826]